MSLASSDLSLTLLGSACPPPQGRQFLLGSLGILNASKPPAVRRTFPHPTSVRIELYRQIHVAAYPTKLHVGQQVQDQMVFSNRTPRLSVNIKKLVMLEAHPQPFPLFFHGTSNYHGFPSGGSIL